MISIKKTFLKDGCKIILSCDVEEATLLVSASFLVMSRAFCLEGAVSLPPKTGDTIGL